MRPHRLNEKVVSFPTSSYFNRDAATHPSQPRTQKPNWDPVVINEKVPRDPLQQSCTWRLSSMGGTWNPSPTRPLETQRSVSDKVAEGQGHLELKVVPMEVESGTQSGCIQHAAIKQKHHHFPFCSHLWYFKLIWQWSYLKLWK